MIEVAASGNTTTRSGFTASPGLGWLVAIGADLYMVVGQTIDQMILATGATTTFAGTQLIGSSDSTDGTGATARMDDPSSLATDGTRLYFTDAVNQTIRQVVIATGDTTTIAGAVGASGSVDSTDGTGATARFYFPQGIATDGTNLYVADSESMAIRKVVIATGDTTTLAGTLTAAGTTDSTDGTGATAKFWLPTGIVMVGTNLYVVDQANDAIRKVVIATGDTTTLAGALGTSGTSDSTDGTGATARFSSPGGLATDGTNLYVADTYNNAIRKVVISTGDTTTIASASRPSNLTTDGVSLYFTGYKSTTIQMINLATLAQSTYLGPGGVMNIASNLMPSVGSLLFTSQGFFFGTLDSGIYEIH